MSFFGHIIAGARELPFGGPLGALLERAARHIPSWHPHADGAVTRDEVAAFREVFQVPPSEEDHVRLVFDLARNSTAGFESYARQIGRLFANDRAALEDLLGGLFHIALADGGVCPAEDAHLREAARHFGFGAGDYARIRAPHIGGEEVGVEDPHAILGVGRDASPGGIREAYHRLVRESHPDLVIAQGRLPECIALATARVARINAAYDRLAKSGVPPA